MRRTLIYLGICMPLCLILVPDRTPVAMSIAPSSVDQHKNEGQKLPDEQRLALLAENDPVAFLDACLTKQCREIHGYSGVLHKQERIKGKDNPPEVIDFWFREEPYTVLMKWREGARDAKSSLYIHGQNNNKAAVLTNTKLSMVLDLDPEGRLAQAAGRYCIREFSMRQGTERTLRAMKAAQEHGTLHVEYLGKEPVSELDGRVCYLLKRTCAPAEDDGLTTLEIAIDAETWMQIGSTLRDANGKLIARYYFTDLKVNPEFAPDQFERAALKK